MTVTITRLYPSHAEAHAVVEALRAANVGDRNISVLASNADEWHRDKTPATYPDKDFDGRDDRAEAAAGGAGVGAAVGGTVGALTGLGLMAIPGVGPDRRGGLAGGDAGRSSCGRRDRRRDRRTHPSRSDAGGSGSLCRKPSPRRRSCQRRA